MNFGARNVFIKIGAYLILFFGVIFSLSAVLAAGIILITMPEAPLQKKSLVAGAALILALLVFLSVFAVFEGLIELTIVGNKMGEELLHHHLPLLDHGNNIEKPEAKEREEKWPEAQS